MLVSKIFYNSENVTIIRDGHLKLLRLVRLFDLIHFFNLFIDAFNSNLNFWNKLNGLKIQVDHLIIKKFKQFNLKHSLMSSCALFLCLYATRDQYFKRYNNFSLSHTRSQFDILNLRKEDV